MEASLRTSRILLTKYTLLVLCVHLCAALDYYSFYAGLVVRKEDIAQTLPLSTICECHSACKAIVSCTAATHVAAESPGNEPKCLLSKKPWIVKNDLAEGNVDHTTIIKGYQVKFVDEKTTFIEAKQACKAMRMRLATPSDAASRNLLAEIHKERYPSYHERGTWSYWVDITKTGDKWTWGDRVEVTPEAGADKWVPEYLYWGTCSMVSVQANFKLISADCTYDFGFICTP